MLAEDTNLLTLGMLATGPTTVGFQSISWCVRALHFSPTACTPSSLKIQIIILATHALGSQACDGPGCTASAWTGRGRPACAAPGRNASCTGRPWGSAALVAQCTPVCVANSREATHISASHLPSHCVVLRHLLTQHSLRMYCNNPSGRLYNPDRTSTQ